MTVLAPLSTHCCCCHQKQCAQVIGHAALCSYSDYTAGLFETQQGFCLPRYWLDVVIYLLCFVEVAGSVCRASFSSFFLALRRCAVSLNSVFFSTVFLFFSVDSFISTTAAAVL